MKFKKIVTKILVVVVAMTALTIFHPAVMAHSMNEMSGVHAAAAHFDDSETAEPMPLRDCLDHCLAALGGKSRDQSLSATTPKVKFTQVPVFFQEPVSITQTIFHRPRFSSYSLQTFLSQAITPVVIRT